MDSTVRGVENEPNNYNGNEVSTLGVFLVMRDATEEKLLFRFPFRMEGGDLGGENSSVSGKPQRYSLPVTEQSESKQPPAAASLLPAYTELATSFGATSSDKEEINKVIGITDSAFANLFGAIKVKLCDKKFELKVDNVRFVGHPTRLGNDRSFHVVFALKANASQDIVRGYHELSQMIATALKSEENRCGYFSDQSRLMVGCHDEVSIPSNDPNFIVDHTNPYELVLDRSPLANHIRTLFIQVLNDGNVHIRINDCYPIDFCLPQKVHLNLNSTDTGPLITPANIHVCLQRLRPYHTILLMKEINEIIAELPTDSSASMVRLIRAANPLKNLLDLSAAADISLSSTFHIVAELIYWGRATLIFPLCETNMYTLHPDARIDIQSQYIDEFEAQFPGENYLKQLCRISTGVMLSQLRNPMDTPAQSILLVPIIIWMLRKRLLIQLHTYAQFVPLENGSSSLSKRVEENHNHCDAKINGNGISSQENRSFGISPANKHFTEVSLNIDPQQITATTLHPVSPKDAAELILREIGLQPEEIAAVMAIPSSRNLDELTLFAKLCPYFDGHHHIDDIMYYENLRRPQIMQIIERFQPVLIIWQYEDATVVQLQPYNVLDIH